MIKYDSQDFLRWLETTRFTEYDIIKCRKMQSASITETENAFGISTISVCGFDHMDVIKLGGEIKQRYDEDKTAFYKRAHSILGICCELMDSVNEVLADEGAWSAGYFQGQLEKWFEGK